MNDRKIEIKRNIIEQFLMKVKDLYRWNKKLVIYSLVLIIAVSALLITGVVYIKSREQNEIKTLETIINKYYSDKANLEKNINKTIDDLNELIKSSFYGYVNKNGYYIIAGLYLSQNKYNEGKEYLMKFADKSPSSFFAPLALHRAGIICEKLNDITGAFQIYNRLEKEYKECIISDEIYYNLGRMYHKKGDKFKAEEYYNKVIKEYPVSIFSSKAKKRLLLLGYHKESVADIKPN
ncbi:MAG: tetratricopeptide repeat protein [Spirochaetes bacterium]|nr:tetratricopeptide repeat protein [Spirochaetota bacterium]